MKVCRYDSYERCKKRNKQSGLYSSKIRQVSLGKFNTFHRVQGTGQFKYRNLSSVLWIRN
jgi:hypothetical protein